MNKYLGTVFCVAAAISLMGCSSIWLGANNEIKRNSVSSSLVDFLYPGGELPRGNQEMPALELPVRVGVAFVPSNRYSLSANTQNQLMQQVKGAFADRPFVDDIQLIPEVYLRSAKGMLGMQQVARMHNVDVMALVSYDQLAISGERDSSILYWTIVGALVVKGNTHEVQTMVDTAVFDVATGQLLIRAPGQAAGQQNATYVDASRDARHLETETFAKATQQMVTHLEVELENFRTHIKQGRRATVHWSEERRSGGGSLSILLILVLVPLIWVSRPSRLCDIYR